MPKKPASLAVDLEEAKSAPVPQKESDIRTLLGKQMILMQQIIEQNKKIQRRQTWLAVSGVIRLLIVAIPIILAIIYLLPFATEYFELYAELLSGSGVDRGSIGNLLSDIDEGSLKEIIQQYKQ